MKIGPYLAEILQLLILMKLANMPLRRAGRTTKLNGHLQWSLNFAQEIIKLILCQLDHIWWKCVQLLILDEIAIGAT